MTYIGSALDGAVADLHTSPDAMRSTSLPLRSSPDPGTPETALALPFDGVPHYRELTSPDPATRHLEAVDAIGAAAQFVPPGLPIRFYSNSTSGAPVNEAASLLVWSLPFGVAADRIPTPVGAADLDWFALALSTASRIRLHGDVLVAGVVQPADALDPHETGALPGWFWAHARCVLET